MGHYLDPLLDQVKAKYSQDVQEAARENFEYGISYAESLIEIFCHTKLNATHSRMIDVDELLTFVALRPTV